ncbi:Crp/Fnr family transcriptional regulator [Clostridium sp.]|uniref:Crp/Fnr family transcriptional regulator n=1 Tax=Clostridium sp. TaxID=1506 RepID=UPI001A4088CB|nr:Crp/Fnr family transcriptional regulator [Clostridium sp.]MBK5242289.1 Crp/Fnr family transcriptional regulator [Clostridium sp.]
MGISSLEIDGLFNSYLFSGTNRTILEGILLEKANISDFKKNCTIYDRDNYFNGLGIIINGSAIVTKGNDGDLVLRVLNKGDIFGVATIFSKQNIYVSKISSIGNCKILFIDENLIEKMFELDFILVKNYISVLTEKIYFLNRKIDGFTVNTVEEKLSIFLRNNARMTREGQYEVDVKIGFTELSKMLNISRASLYRIICDLEEKKIIKKEGKQIFIKNINEL